MKNLLIQILILLTINAFSQGVSNIDSLKSVSKKDSVQRSSQVASASSNLQNGNGNAPTYSPGADALGRYGDYPIDLVNGLIPIEIPVHTVQSGNITVPVKLSYHSAGIKVNDVATPVGLGWSLMAGGAITRSMKGEPDEITMNNVNYPQPPKSESTNDFYCFLGRMIGTPNNVADVQPDIFYYNFPNGAGRFQLAKYKADSTELPTAVFVTIPYKPIKINYQLDGQRIIEFTLTDTDGTQYIFGKTNDFLSGLYTEVQQNPVGSPYISAWYLRQIISAETSDLVEFEYTASQINKYGIHSTNLTHTLVTKGIGGNTNTYTYNRPAAVNYSKSIYLKKVKFNNGQVEMNYVADREDFVNLNNTAGFRLNSIDISKKTSATNYTPIKKYVLGQSYFSSTDGYSLFDESLTNTHLASHALRKRLKLNSVTEQDPLGASLPSYLINYNTESLPIIGSTNQDFWGFYNGATNKHSLLTHNASDSQLFGGSGNNYNGNNTYTSLDIQIANGADRNPNATKMGVGLIESIVFPNSSKIKFLFGTNKIITSIDGGMRIEGVENYSNASDTDFSLKSIYSYDAAYNSRATNLPILVSAGNLFTSYSNLVVESGSTAYCDLYTNTNFSENNDFLMGDGGASIAYSKVTIKQVDKDNNAIGKTVKTFEVETDSTPTFIKKSKNNHIPAYTNGLQNSAFRLPSVNKGWKRGNLITEEIYKGTATLLKKIENIYGLILCDSIVSSFYGAVLYQPNTIVTTASGGCTTDQTAYQPNGTCSGGTDYTYSSANHYYNYVRQNAEVGYKRLNSSTVTNYDENGLNPVVETNTYAYFNNNKLQGLKSETTTNSDGTVRRVEYTYPQNLVANATYAAMVAKNKLQPIIFAKTYRDNVLLHETNTDYALFGTYYLPKTISETFAGGTSQTIVTNDYQTDGYLASSIFKSGQKLSNTYYLSTDYGKTNLLKTKTIGGGATGSLLTRTENYDYEPLVGIKTSTDINGYVTSYTYDNFLRLSYVKDHNNNYNGKKFYHYAGEALPADLGASPPTNSNFTATATALSEQTTTLSTDVDLTRLDISYSDGLGRPIQTIAWKASADKSKDILTNSVVYDAFGRAIKSLIPTPSDVATGAYKATHETLATTFYGDTKPNSLLSYEESPLNRPTTLLGPGANWHSANKAEAINYLSAGNTVNKYTLSANGAATTAKYDANTLYLTIYKDEIANETAMYRDKEGNTLLESKKVNADTTLYTTHIYDALNRLSYTLMPEAYGTATFTETDAVFTNHIYAYHYDNKGRMFEKHIPGAGWTRFVFDKTDKLVLSQNAKELTDGRYSFTKHDALSRDVQAGILKTTAGRATLQAAFDAHASDTYESRNDGLTLSYTDNSFPTGYKPAEADHRLINFYDNYTWTGATAFTTGQSTHSQGNSIGLATGTKAKDLASSTAIWYSNTSYYDYLGRQIQEHIENQAGTDRADMSFRYDGALLNSSYTHAAITVQNTITYDHQARPLTNTHTIGNTAKTLANYEFDALGRLSTKTIAPSTVTYGNGANINTIGTGLWANDAIWNTGQQPCGNENIVINVGNVVSLPANNYVYAGTLKVFGELKLGTNATIYLNTSAANNTNLTALQTTQYTYNTRSWLTAINPVASTAEADLFSYKIEYDYNGNIASNSWASPTNKCIGTLQSRSYAYTYDQGSRLRKAMYTGQGDYSLPNIHYTNNGNIDKLVRKGKLANGNDGTIDNLSYAYSGNRLQNITDGVTGNNKVDFVAGTGNYTYNNDGSMATDPNENSAIVYDDFINQPKTITKGTTTNNYTYTGDGTLLKATDANADIWEHFGPFTYKNNVLFEIATSEGRAINHNGAYIYEFDHTDHLGNKRVSFTGIDNHLKITSVQDFDPFGVIHAGNSYANGLIDRNSYQGKTKEQGLNRIDLGFRSFNPTTGIFDRSDPLAESTFGQSPYSYTLNNPVNFIDEFGLEGSGWNTRGRQETEAETANKEAMQKSDNASFIKSESQKLLSNDSGMLPGADAGTKGWSSREKTTGNVLSYTDVNDFTVLATTLTRGRNAVNIDGTNATFSDKMWAAGGLIIPAASGSAIKKVGGKIIDGASDFIHGNSKLSQKLQHGYAIFDKLTNKILEFGISGQNRTLNQIINKSSPRIAQKLKKKYENNPNIAGTVLKDNLGVRSPALNWEQSSVNDFFIKNNNLAPKFQFRPKPTIK